MKASTVIASGIALFLFIYASPAKAACDYLTRGLQGKITEFRRYRGENLATQAQLLASENACKARGDKISARAAQAALALSCEAQKDANALHLEISSLGQHCETIYKRLYQLQTDLQARFDLVLADAADGEKLLRKSEILQRKCGEEIQAISEMAKGLRVLGGNISAVKAKSQNGETEYLKLRETGHALAESAAARSKACKSEDSLAEIAPKAAEPPRYAAGSGQAGIRNPSSKSDLTGTAEAVRAQKRAEAIIRKESPTQQPQ